MEGGDGGGPIDTWLNKHRRLYIEATRHPFILSIKHGTVEISSFKRWLKIQPHPIPWGARVHFFVSFSSDRCKFIKEGQDYIFVREFVPFIASVLLKAWKETDDDSDIDVILGGIAALNDEISWFKKEASKWDVPISGIAPQKPNQDYYRFLESLMGTEIDYTVAITAFWAIEAVYQESFSLCLEDDSRTPEELVSTCQRWGNDGFRQYCNSLCRIANRRLANATEDVVMKSEEAFVHVLEKEVGFWNMSYGDSLGSG